MLTNYLVLAFPTGALLVPGATWPVAFPDEARLETPPVSVKSPGALFVAVPVEFMPVLVPAPTEVPFSIEPLFSVELFVMPGLVILSC